jgi:hypothetical protein
MSEYTDKNFSLEDWRLIQDSILENISYLKSAQKWGYEEEVSRLEVMLERVHPKTLTNREKLPPIPSHLPKIICS